jgi:hypothetical protein
MEKKKRKSDSTSMVIGDPIIGAVMGVGSLWLCRFITFLSQSSITGA